MTDEQIARLRQRLEDASQEQPELLVLRAELLRLGGAEMVAPPGSEPDLLALVSDGVFMAGAVVEEAMQSRACHQNVAQLWRQGSLDGIGTGYALSGELWRQHSWGVRGESIVETTIARSQYFGIVLIGEKAERFTVLNPPD